MNLGAAVGVACAIGALFSVVVALTRFLDGAKAWPWAALTMILASVAAGLTL